MTTEQQNFIDTELGPMEKHPNGDYCITNGKINLESRSTARVFNQDKIPNVSTETGHGSWYCYDTLGLFLGLLLSKGYQIELTFKNPGSNILVLSNIYSKIDDDAIIGGHGTVIKQAWRDTLHWTKDNREYVVTLSDIVGIKAWLSPLVINHQTSRTHRDERSVARLEAEVNGNKLTYSYTTAVLHTVYQLAARDSSWLNPSNTRDKGLTNIHQSAIGQGSWLVKTCKDIVSILYVTAMDRNLHVSNDALTITEERLMSVSRISVSFEKVSDIMSSYLNKFSRYSPIAFQEAMEARNHPQ